MNSEIRMSISSMTRNGDHKAVYVQFTDGGSTAEFAIPEMKLLRNDGFTPEEIEQLFQYIQNEQQSILDIARKVNPMKGFLGEPQGQ